MIRSIVSHGYGRLEWVSIKPELQMEKILFATDELSGLIGACAMGRPSKTEQVSGVFEGLLASPGTMILYTIITIAISAAVCAMGIQKGVEQVTKIMILLLFSLLVILAIKAVSLPNSEMGLKSRTLTE